MEKRRSSRGWPVGKRHAEILRLRVGRPAGAGRKAEAADSPLPSFLRASRMTTLFAADEMLGGAASGRATHGFGYELGIARGRGALGSVRMSSNPTRVS